MSIKCAFFSSYLPAVISVRNDDTAFVDFSFFLDGIPGLKPKHLAIVHLSDSYYQRVLLAFMLTFMLANTQILYCDF